MWDKKMKDVNLIEPAHEPSQAKLELGSFTNKAEPSRLAYNRVNFEPSFLQAFFERVANHKFLNTPKTSSSVVCMHTHHNMLPLVYNFQCYYLCMVVCSDSLTYIYIIWITRLYSRIYM
ncbi:hypothetical protein HanIR_Chr01g0007971 [Helianthus annuus]|nr:hypothetical protein HanIR_Chr01g0007971 [Helianthus annuus]